MGDLPAKARLIVTDKATQDRRYVAFGHDLVASEENPPLLLTTFVTEGFSGVAKTRSGSYSANVIRATAVSTPTTILGSGRIEHVGSFAVHLRAYALSENARLRIAYRNGDGPLISLRWQTPPILNGFCELAMGEVFLDAVALGDQTSEIRVEVKSEEGATEIDVDYLMLVPTGQGSGRARGLAGGDPANLVVYDGFAQTSGNLSGKALPIGGNWAGAGDTDDFNINTTTQRARRTAVSDAGFHLGRYAIAGTGVHTGLRTQVEVTASSQGSGDYAGVFQRYIDTNNWFMVVWVGNLGNFLVLKRVASTETVVKFNGVYGLNLQQGATIELTIDESGAWTVEAAGKTKITGWDPDLAPGGALAEGKCGIYDAKTGGNANTREFDNFEAIALEPAGIACYSGQSIEFRHDGVLREDEAGEYAGPPDFYRGANFYLHPSGKDKAINRLAVRMRRNDAEAEPDGGVEDEQAIEVKVIERFLIPR